MARWDAPTSQLEPRSYRLTCAAPELTRSSLVERKLNQKRDFSGSVGFNAIDRLAMGVVSLSDQALILELSQAADAILSQNDGLSVSRNRLVCARTDSSRELAALIAGASKNRVETATDANGYMTIARPSDKRPFRIAVFPLPETEVYLAGAEAPRVLVFIDDPEERPQPRGETLQHLYGVSRAQSQVLARLLQGLKRDEIADDLGLSRNTIKTHEREIFHILDVRSRSELLRLVLPNFGTLCS